MSNQSENPTIGFSISGTEGVKNKSCGVMDIKHGIASNPSYFDSGIADRETR